MPHQNFTFTTQVWLYPGMAGWHFVTLPVKTAEEITYYFGHLKKGWGSLPVTVTVGATTWQTSIFPDKKSQSYLLPLKAQVRQKETIKAGDQLELSLELKG